MARVVVRSDLYCRTVVDYALTVIAGSSTGQTPSEGARSSGISTALRRPSIDQGVNDPIGNRDDMTFYPQPGVIGRRLDLQGHRRGSELRPRAGDVIYRQLPVDLAKVVINRRRAQEQLLGDLRIRGTTGREGGYVSFLRRQLLGYPGSALLGPTSRCCELCPGPLRECRRAHRLE